MAIQTLVTLITNDFISWRILKIYDGPNSNDVFGSVSEFRNNLKDKEPFGEFVNQKFWEIFPHADKLDRMQENHAAQSSLEEVSPEKLPIKRD